MAMQIENKSETRGRHIYEGLLGLGLLGGSAGFSEQVGYRVLLKCTNSHENELDDNPSYSHCVLIEKTLEVDF